MGCFCHHTVGPLSASLSLVASAELSLAGAKVSPKQLLAELLAEELAKWLAAHGLPAQPWQPEPAWLAQPMPQVRLSAQALATISALAQLRAQVLAQFGLDLLVAAHASAFARIVATMAARLSALPAVAPPAAMLRLAAQAEAIAQVSAALQAGLFAPPPALLQALTHPAGILMSEWRALLAALRSLLPLIAAAKHLNLSLDASFHAQLAAALRVLRNLALPALAPAQLSAVLSLTATLSAVARLRAATGLDPLTQMAQIRAMVTARLVAMVKLLPGPLAPLMRMPSPLAVLEALASLLPKVPFCPSQMAPPAVMNLALSANAQAIAAMNWQVPEMTAIPALMVGPATCALAAQIQAALAINAVLPSPCGSGCDAARIARALAA